MRGIEESSDAARRVGNRRDNRPTCGLIVGRHERGEPPKEPIACIAGDSGDIDFGHACYWEGTTRRELPGGTAKAYANDIVVVEE
jgi:hypothetical protein